MANPFSAALRSFWHTMTSNDRHSSFDSPQRTGRHVPLHNSRDGILTGVATASDSRADISSPYSDEGGRGSPTRNGHQSPIARGYSPGMRSQSAQGGDGFEVQSPGDVPMQPFQNGLPPAPPVRYSWQRIDSWAEENYPELWDQLGEGATVNDLNDLEHQLDCSLPQDVRESLMVHDGQERGGRPTGIIFGSMLMDCEEIAQEWETWRRVNEQYLLETTTAKPTTPSKAFGGSGEASSSKQPPPPPRPSSSSSAGDGEWRQTLLARQGSVPPNSVQKAYAHAGWIPLVRDWGGNNLAVDLAPGPNGRWGQIILFGRDYDTKYVVARSWGAFLALVADDLNSGKWFVEEDSGELKLREFRDARVEPAYFNILRWRMDQKHGRRPPNNKRQSMAAGKAPSPRGSRSASPYGSPVEPSGDVRGRSLQRLNGSSPLASPMRAAGYGKVPLGRVTEETAIPGIPGATIEPSKLVEVETPRQSEEARNGLRISTLARSESDLLKDKENENPAKMNGKTATVEDDAMKTIEI